jgi:hypothetical protein
MSKGVGIATNGLHMLPSDDFANPLSTSDSPRTAYGSGIEALAVSQEIGDFVATASPAYALIRRQFGSCIRLVELKALVTAAIAVVQYKDRVVLPKMSRNTKRSWQLLVKYIDTHYGSLAPVFPNLTLCDKHRDPIPIVDATRRGAKGHTS